MDTANYNQIHCSIIITGPEQMGYNLLQNTPTLIPLYANMYIAVQIIATAKKPKCLIQPLL